MASLHQAVRLQLCKTQLIQALFAELDRSAGNYDKHEEHVGNLAEHVGICGQKLGNWWQKVGDWWQSCCFWVQHMYSIFCQLPVNQHTET